MEASLVLGSHFLHTVGFTARFPGELQNYTGLWFERYLK